MCRAWGAMPLTSVTSSNSRIPANWPIERKRRSAQVAWSRLVLRRIGGAWALREALPSKGPGDEHVLGLRPAELAVRRIDDFPFCDGRAGWILRLQEMGALAASRVSRLQRHRWLLFWGHHSLVWDHLGPAHGRRLVEFFGYGPESQPGSGYVVDVVSRCQPLPGADSQPAPEGFERLLPGCHHGGVAAAKERDDVYERQADLKKG